MGSLSSLSWRHCCKYHCSGCCCCHWTEADCPVWKIWWSVLVYPYTNKSILPNKWDSFFFLPTAAVSVPSGCISRQGAGSVCRSGQKCHRFLSPVRRLQCPVLSTCTEQGGRSSSGQRWHPSEQADIQKLTRQVHLVLWRNCALHGDSIFLLSDQEIRW